MTLDEAITHAEDVAKEQDKLSKRYDDASGYSRSHNDDIRTSDAKKCERCAEDHRQLAEWLKELKLLREQTRWIPVSERLPEEGGKYICWFKEQKRDIVTMVAWQPKLRSWNLTGNMAYWKVFAWMPLPKTYKPQESEDE